METNPSFYASRYLDIIAVLKSVNLWDRENGLYFLPLIQHCMPAPTLSKIHQLLTDLVHCHIDTDWAPLTKTEQIRSKVGALLNKADAPDQESNSLGRDYPIAYGIHRIAGLKEWPLPIRNLLLIYFVETIHEKMGAEHAITPEDFYTDVYQFRDVCISHLAEKYSLKGYADTNKNLHHKQLRIDRLLDEDDRFGNSDQDRQATPSFWEEPPFEPFYAYAEDLGEVAEKTTPIYPHQQELSNAYHLNSQEQFSNLYSERLLYSRRNTPSLADPNQLSWITIFKYWNFLIEKDKPDHFFLSLITLLTGIRKKRWEQGLKSTQRTLDSVHFNEELHCIEYKINSGANDFEKNNSDYGLAKLAIPKCLPLSLESICNGLNDEYAIRAFNKENPGQSPTLNNIARSGHTLLRQDISGATLAYLLAGKVPIEFKNRSTYMQANNEEINILFQNCFNKLLSISKRHLKKLPKLQIQFSKFDAQTIASPSKHEIGSQLAEVNWDFSKFQIEAGSKPSISDYILIANQFELYLFWLAQFALATRASGDLTESIQIGKYWLHRDKDSADYLESKLLIAPKLLEQQTKEIEHCRSALIKFAEKQSFTIKHIQSNYPHRFYKLKGKRITTYELKSSEALTLTKQYWNMIPNGNRPNAHRHQAATLAHKSMNEVTADTWLGHHIDGWYFSSPESSGSIRSLELVLNAQNELLDKLGFHLIRNPLL